MKRTLIALFATAALAMPALSQQQDPNQNAQQDPTAQQGQQDQQAGQKQGAQSQPFRASKAQIRMLQQGLNDMGLNAGRPDGVLGNQTRQALQKFQSQHGLNASGQLDRRTVALLRAQRGKTAAPAQTGKQTASRKGSKQGSSHSRGGQQGGRY